MKRAPDVVTIDGVKYTLTAEDKALWSALTGRGLVHQPRKTRSQFIRELLASAGSKPLVVTYFPEDRS